MKLDVSILIACIGCIVGLLGFLRNKNKDNQEQGSLQADVKYISRGIDEIRVDNKELGRKMTDINERLIKVEESTKSAHKRIDNLKEGM